MLNVSWENNDFSFNSNGYLVNPAMIIITLDRERQWDKVSSSRLRLQNSLLEAETKKTTNNGSHFYFFFFFLGGGQRYCCQRSHGSQSQQALITLPERKLTHTHTQRRGLVWSGGTSVMRTTGPLSLPQLAK